MSTLSWGDFAPQGKVTEGLQLALQQGRLPHATLYTGLSGTGKRTLADLVARTLLCQGDGRRPCGVCAACQQYSAGTHQDFTLIRPGSPIAPGAEKKRKTIPVEDIRELKARAGRHSYEGGAMVFLIQQAESMTVAAQNALLKTLEEPQPGVYLLLTSDNPRGLLTTILSRCREYRLHVWPDETISRILSAKGVDKTRQTQILSLCEGSIGKAEALAGDEGYWQRRAQVIQDFFSLDKRSDIPRISARWKDAKDDKEQLLNDVDEVIRSLMLVRLKRADAGLPESLGLPQAWQRMAQEAPLTHFVKLQDAVAQARRMSLSNVTWQAVVEQLLYSLMEEKSKW